MDNDTLGMKIAAASLLRGEFRLRSGAISNEYFDKYRFESDPALLSAIADALTPLIPPSTDALAGLELGGVPLATALSLRTGLPAVFVRKQAKEYGTRRLAEGGEIAGRRLLIVEDVATSGGQIIESCAALRQAGAVIEHVLCVIDREGGATTALADEGLELRALFRKTQLK